MEDEIIIHVTPHTEGGLNYDIYLNQDAELPSDSDDGGICTSGTETPEQMALPYSREDWANAFDMARDQALFLMFDIKREDKEVVDPNTCFCPDRGPHDLSEHANDKE
jgi:hypothetical protein